MIPFVVMPLDSMKKVVSPFMGLGYRVAKAFPYLELQLKQANIDANAEEYAAIMVFSFTLYFFLFSLLAAAILGRITTKSHLIAGIVVPEYLLLAITIGLIGAFLVFVQISMYPTIQIKKKIRAVESNLVYALRTMLVQLKSGVGLFNSLNMIATGDYGELSKEMKDAVDDINTGASEESALQKIATKNPSTYLRKVVWQIVNGMKAGADVSDVLKESVKSMTREQEIEIQRYGGSLRMLSLIYLMIGVIIPALGLTFLIVLGSFPRISITETTFWMLLGFVVVGEFMFIGIIKSKRPNLISV